MSALDEILENIELTDWLDYEAIDWKKGSSGQAQVRICPSCGDSRSKVYMSMAKKRGICFHCNKSYNIFSFAREHLHTSSRDTIKHFEDYAARHGLIRRVPKPAVLPATVGWEMPESEALPTPEGHTHPFLINRRITLETQALFGLRWCESGSYEYRDIDDHPRSMNFSGRVLIPVADLDGTVQTFQGRDATGTAEKRYLFPPMLPGTGRFLYGAHLVMDKPHLVANEGPFDVMASHQAVSSHPDFRDVGAIGTFGLQIGAHDEKGDDQLGRLRKLRAKGMRRLTILFDGERKAWNAALEAGKLMLPLGIKVFVGALPADRDPNEVDTAVVRQAIIDARELTPTSYFSLRLRPPYA